MQDILERVQQFLVTLCIHSERKNGLYIPFLAGNGRKISVTITAVSDRELRIRAKRILAGGPDRANELNQTLRGGLRCVAEDDNIDLLCDLPEYITASEMLEQAVAETLFRIYLIEEFLSHQNDL